MTLTDEVRAVLARCQEKLDPHRDAVLWGEVCALLASTQDSAGEVAWPKLEKPAKVGAGTFAAGLSARLVVEAAYRQHQYAEEPPFSDEQIKAMAQTLATPQPAGPAVEVTGEREAEAFAYGEAVERKAQEIYEGWFDQPGYVPWVSGGNATKQDEARRLAVAALSQQADWGVES